MRIQKGFGHNGELLLLRRRKKVGSKACSSGSRVAPQQATAAAAANGGGSLQQASQAKQPATRQCRQAGRLTSTRQAASARTSTQSMCMVEKQEHTRTRESSPSHSALASNPRKESACVSVAAVRAKIEQLAATAAAMVAARQRAQATAALLRQHAMGPQLSKLGFSQKSAQNRNIYCFCRRRTAPRRRHSLLQHSQLARQAGGGAAMRRILKLGAALDDGMLLALLSLYVFKCNEVSVLYTVCLRRLSALCCARRAARQNAILL